jgi:hypothetical protein
MGSRARTAPDAEKPPPAWGPMRPEPCLGARRSNAPAWGQGEAVIVCNHDDLQKGDEPMIPDFSHENTKKPERFLDEFATVREACPECCLPLAGLCPCDRKGGRL